MMATKRILGTAVLVMQVMTHSAPAMAVVSSQFDANAVDANKVKERGIECGSFCSNLLDGVSWDASEHRWCANHGSPTDPAIGPTASAHVPTGTGAGSCNVPMASGERCADVNRRLLRCKFHNSQVESQCMAYRAAEDASKAQGIVVALDVAAAGACTAACAYPAVNPAALACQGLGLSASVTETVMVFKANMGKLGKIINGIGALGTMGATAVHVGQAATGGDTFGIGSGTKQGQDNQQKAACASAALFAIMAGVRGHNIKNYKDNVQDASCKQVRKLYSDAKVANPDGQPDVNYANNTPTNGTSGGGTGASADTGGTSAANDYVTSGVDKALSSESALVGTTAESATDGGLLRGSGLDKLLGQEAKNLDLAGLSKGTTSPASALGAALGGMGELGQGIAALAAAAQEEGQELASHLGLGMGSGYSSGGGSMLASGSKGAGENPFAGLFGAAGAKDAGGREPASMQFGQAKQFDIWHTGTTQNIFEIVSSKWGQVSTRVQGK